MFGHRPFRRRQPFTPAPALVEDVALACGRNLLRRFGPEGLSRLDGPACPTWFLARCVGVKPLPGAVQASPEDIVDPELEAGGPSRRRRHLAEVRRALGDACAQPPERLKLGRTSLGRNLRRIAAELDFDRVEREVVSVLVVAALHPGLRALLWAEQPSRVEHTAELVATALGLGTAPVRDRLRRDASLRLTGLVEDADSTDPSDCSVAVDSRIVELALESALRPGAVLKRFLTVEPAVTLADEDFRHLEADLDVAERLLRRALEVGQRGVNLLFHGGSGTGKTEAARLLARRLGVPIYLAGAADVRGESPNGRERLASAGVAQRILPAGRALVLADEAEDVFGSGWSPFGEVDLEAKPRPSKLWLNRFLEGNRIPTLWTTNRVSGLDPALLRRFSFLIGFRSLGPATRRAVWVRHAGGDLAAPELDRLAEAYEVSPGEIGGAVTSARLAGGGKLDRGALERILAGTMVARPGRRVVPARRAGAEYRPEAVRASTDLVRLADRLAQWRPGSGPGPSLCLYGRSGTGKSEFVHYLARRLGRPVVVRRPSDLMSKWHGETEQNLGEAFAEAGASGAVLLFDEGDSFVRDRRFAQASWEVAIVNEFLQQLEAFRGLAAVTTNLFRDLDQAVLRRFTFKVEFLPPLPGQVLALFDAHLAPLLGDPGEAKDAGRLATGLRHAGQLMPGDFSVVSRKAALLGGRWRLDELLAELAEEAQARGMDGRPVGF